MVASHLTLLKWLRAAGEPSRLRLLALCAEGALSVSDLAQVLAQSEPRVSRHLKILCEAGLIERSRQGQWVHYRLVAEAAAASFVRGLLSQLERRDPVPLGDRTRARALIRLYPPVMASQATTRPSWAGSTAARNRSNRGPNASMEPLPISRK